MTDHELERRLQAWYRAEIGDGDTAPSELRAAVLAIPRKPSSRTRSLGSRRNITLLAAAALLLVGGAVGVGSGVVRLPSVVQATPPLDASFSLIATPAPTEASTTEPVPLRAGVRYGSLTFTEPFHFVMFKSEQGPEPGSVAAFADRSGSAGGLRIRYGCCWSTWFIDDQPVSSDLCDATKGTLPDVPATPEAVGEWLRSSSRLTVSEPTEIVVDGRTALRFDIESFDVTTSQSEGCASESPRAGFRFYAIPTGDDTILYVLWSDEGSLPSVKAGADELVRSMTFD